MMRRTFTGQSNRKYHLVRELGRGGFGVVYQARGEDGSKYAVKVISGVDDPLIRASFEQETRSVQSLSHVALVQVVDQGIADHKSVFVVMEYCPDGDYRSILRSYRGTDPQPERVIDDFRMILNGLAVLHTKVVHRDLKPENILVKDKQLKISDFGLAKFVDEATRTLTFKGGGTPRYMAPEVWAMRRVSRSTDLYSIGVMLFEVFTGVPPFEADDINALREKHLYEPAPRAKGKSGAVPDHVDGVIKRLLNKEPVDRYQTAEEVAAALDNPTRGGDPVIAEIVTEAKKRHDEAETRRLQVQVEHERALDQRKRNSYMEQRMVDLIDDVVAEANNQLQETRLSASGDSKGKVYHFGSRSLHVEFFGEGELYNNPEVPGRMRTLREQGAVHGGFIEIRERGEDRQGWNVVLVREAGSEYGEWRIVETRVSALTGRVAKFEPLATQARLFADNLACHWGRAMHVYNLVDKPLERTDIVKILRVLVTGGQ